MHVTLLPPLIDAFVSPIRDSQVAQVAIVAILLLIVLDVVFGLICAMSRHEYQSDKMRKGIGHKAAELGFIFLGLVIDGALAGGFDIGFSAPVLVTICVYLCIMEIGSLMETFALMNPQLAGSPLFKFFDTVVHRDEQVDPLNGTMEDETEEDDIDD